MLNRVVNELKQILKKDFNKKMIENTAFKLFEVWWDEKKSEKNQAHGENAVVNNAMKEDGGKPQGLSSLLEQATPLGLNYDGFGLGIRASMPKMPSFRVRETSNTLCIINLSSCYVYFFIVDVTFARVRYLCSARLRLQAQYHRTRTADSPVTPTWKRSRVIAIWRRR